MATVFEDDNAMFLCGAKTEHGQNCTRQNCSTYQVSIEFINDKKKLVDVIHQTVPKMYQSMFEYPDKLKASFKQFILNEHINSIFCNIWVANEYCRLRRNTGNEYASIHYGHHIMLLLPVNEHDEYLKDKIQTNVKIFMESEKKWWKFPRNLINCFSEIDKMHFSFIPCKMLFDFEEVFYDTLERLPLILRSELKEKENVPIGIINPWWEKSIKEDSKLLLAAIRVGISSLNIVTILSTLCKDIVEEAKTVEIQNNLMIPKISNVCREIVHTVSKAEIRNEDTNPKKICETKITHLYAYLINYYSLFWSERDCRKELGETSEDLNYLFTGIQTVEEIVQNLEHNISTKLNRKTKKFISIHSYNYKPFTNVDENFDVKLNENRDKRISNSSKSQNIFKNRRTNKSQPSKKSVKNGKSETDKNASSVSNESTIALSQSEKIGFVVLNFDPQHDLPPPLTSLPPLIAPKPKTRSSTTTNLPYAEDNKLAYDDKKEALNHFDTSFFTLSNSSRNTGNPKSNFEIPRNPPFEVPSSPIKPVMKSKFKIIFVGETGSGKSTLINGFQNYLNFSELDEFAEISCVIPVKFSVQRSDAPLKDIWIEYGQKDENESFNETSASNTQKPKCYAINDEKYEITIIDTPGTSDTRGSDQDSKNLTMIKETIEEMGKIDAICFVISSNQKRLTPGFESQLNCLLSLFPQENLHNVYFFFTYVSQNYFEIGDGMEVIKEFVKNYNNSNQVDIKITAKNVYQIENDGFRYLISRKAGKPYYSQPEEHYKNCWNFTATEVQRFLDTVIISNNEQYQT